MRREPGGQSETSAQTGLSRTTSLLTVSNAKLPLGLKGGFVKCPASLKTNFLIWSLLASGSLSPPSGLNKGLVMGGGQGSWRLRPASLASQSRECVGVARPHWQGAEGGSAAMQGIVGGSDGLRDNSHHAAACLFTALVL